MLFAVSVCAWADPEEYLKVPAVEYGEREIELKYGTSKLPDGQGRESAGAVGFGYGATPYWFTEAYIKYKKGPGDRTRYDAWEWENKFQITETGKYAFDAGFFTEIEFPRDHNEGYELRVGPLLQTEVGKMQFNANLLLKRQLRGETDPDQPRITELQYQFQAKYRLLQEFEYGLQAFGELGEWDHWESRDKQNHRVGPAVFGKIALGGHHAIRYDVAWLLGASKAAPDSTFRAQLEYEF